MIDVAQFVLLLFIAGTLWAKEKPHKAKGDTRKVVLDSCALIDGRIVELSHAGFVPDELIIPEFILHELQLLADGADQHKRERARYGLDVVKELQDSTNCTVTIDHQAVPDKSATDDKLVALAQKRQAQLYTTDYNLTKVAEIEGVRVLNVNELAQHLRPTALPGEQRTVKIMQKGSSAKQGVGYLEDGTMLVVEGGASHIGKTVNVEITRTHQTVSGKMFFGELTTRAVAKTPAKPRQTPPVKKAAVRSITSRMRRYSVQR